MYLDHVTWYFELHASVGEHSFFVFHMKRYQGSRGLATFDDLFLKSEQGF